MSVAIAGRLKPWKVMDPRACMHEADKYLFKQGGSYVSYRSITASSSSNSSVQWQCNPPSTNQIVSRLVYVTVTFSISINFNNGANPAVDVDGTAWLSDNVIADANLICLRQFPLASVIDTCKVFINGQNFNTSPKHWIHALSRYNLDLENRNIYMSSSPSQPDYMQDFNDYGTTAGIKSPFTGYNQSTAEIPRGAYSFKNISYTSVAGGGDGLTKFEIEITEPLMISPLTCSSYSEKALGQIAEMNVQINWDSKLERIISLNLPGIRAVTGVALTTYSEIKVKVSDNASNKIMFTYITPQSTRPVPPVCTYDFHDYQYRNKEKNTIVPGFIAGAAPIFQEIISDNHTINTIPNKAYIFVRQKESDRNASTADTFARISAISLNFNGQDSLLSGASECDLWRMSVDNGLKMSLIEWQNYSGSVCCIDFGKNLGLGVNQCVGMLGNFDLQIRVTFANISLIAKNFDLCIVYDLAGILTVSASQAMQQMGIVTPDDVLQAEDYKEMSSEFLERMYGGNFMSGLRNVYSKALTLKPYAKKAVKFGQMIAPVVGTLAPRVAPIYNKSLDLASDLLGNGYTKKQIADMKANGWTDAHFRKLLKGGNPVGGNMVGGNPVGGKCIPKSKLKQRISNY